MGTTCVQAKFPHAIVPRIRSAAQNCGLRKSGHRDIARECRDALSSVGPTAEALGSIANSAPFVPSTPCEEVVEHRTEELQCVDGDVDPIVDSGPCPAYRSPNREAQHREANALPVTRYSGAARSVGRKEISSAPAAKRAMHQARGRFGHRQAWIEGDPRGMARCRCYNEGQRSR